eukprot:303839_1
MLKTNNVNLMCDYRNAGFGLTLNASQSLLVNITCLSCRSSDYYLSNAGTVLINAVGLASSNIYAQHMTNSLTITCDGLQSCQYTQIHCPISDLCNVYCTAGACFRTNIHIPNKQYEGLDLNCSINDACHEPIITCTDTDISTIWKWDDALSYFQCASLGCCLTQSQGEITCLAGSYCQVACDVQNCTLHLINGTLAHSLTIDCTGSSCDHATILCPTGDYTSCAILCTGSSCQYAIIRTGTDNIMHNLTLNCGYYQGCQSVETSLDSKSITDVFIHCNGYASCIHMDLLFSTAIINTFHLLCDGHYSCGSAELNAATAIINILNIKCLGRKVCDAIHVSAKINNLVNINCLAKSACGYANVSLISDDSDVNVNIDCSYGDWACAHSEWYFDSNDHTNNNMSLQCGKDRNC